MSSAIIYNSILSQLEITRRAKEAALPALTSSLIDDAAVNLFLQPTIAQCALNPTTWATTVPKLDDTGLTGGPTNTSGGYFCVWDPVYNRCNSGCSWTVPAGITRAGFQLWGGGGGSSSGCCCGGHPGGSTGEYISLIMDVTPGDTYVICNSCTFCCFGFRSGIQLTGGMSCITGPGITSLCAQHGCGTLCSWSCSFANPSPVSTRNICGFIPSNAPTSPGTYQNNITGWVTTAGSTTYVCRYQSPVSPNASGACLCNSGYDYCFTSSCATCGMIPWIASHCTQSPTIVASNRNPQCGWIPRIWPYMCFDTNHYGQVISAPTVCFPSGTSGPTTQMHAGSDCRHDFSSGTCCGSTCSTLNQGMASAPFACMPGHGAVFSHAMGGSNSVCGDVGRGAAVRITYC